LPDIFDLLVRERTARAEAISWPGLKRRQFKFEYAAIEVALIEKFRASLSASTSPSLVEIDGFVSRVGGTRFVLRPSLAVNYGIMCEMEDARYLPTDFQFGRVKGHRVIVKTKFREASTWRLKASGFEQIRLPSEHLRPEISASDASDAILEGYVDPPMQLKRDLISTLVSSPGESRRRGGLTAALLPVQERFSTASYELLKDIRTSIPVDLTSENFVVVSIPGVGRFEISPFPWNIKSMWSSELRSESGSASSSTGGTVFAEITLGISANSVAPKTLEEVWMRSADFPTLLESSIVRYSKPTRFDLDLAKFLITVHSARPFTEPAVEDGLLGLVQSRLVRLRRDYDSLGYSGLIDLDVRSGSPRSIMAIAKSIARSKGIEKVDSELIANALDEFVDSREEIFDVWSELGLSYGDAQISTQKRLARIGRTAERIYAFVREHPRSTRTEIRENLSRVQESIFAKAFDEMLREGILYPTSSIDDRYSVI
jgi:hypothetical protein